MLWSYSCAPYSRGAIRACSQKLRSPLVTRPRPVLLLAKHYFSQTSGQSSEGESRQESLFVPASSRFNEIGVQQLSDHVFSQVFPVKSVPPNPELVALSKEHLSLHDLLGKSQDAAEPVAFDMPPLQGQTLDEHFFKLGMDASEPYLSYAKDYTKVNSPSLPRKWIKRSGWTKYSSDGSWEPVDAPDEEMLTFDTEVMYKEHSFAVMACAVSPTAWYAWLSPWLLGESEREIHLIPLGDTSKSRIVVGHNIGYDRARVLEEYDLKQTRNFFVDTMSLHVAVNGMCSQQRPTWMRHKKNKDLRDKLANESNSVELSALLESKMLSEEEEELWVGRSSVNSLRDVAKFHCDVTIDKAKRDYFGELGREEILEKYEELLDYCAADVAITHRVYKKVFPNFLEVCPHPVSFGALRHLSSVILPVNQTWKEYLTQAEATYHQRLDDVQRKLAELCDEALKVKENPEIYMNDPWLRQLDWSGQEIKMAKGKRKGDPPRPAARQKKPGMPQWYKDLFATNTADINLTVRSRTAPILLKLSWAGYPLTWSDKFGWTFKVPRDQVKEFDNQPVVMCDMAEEKIAELREDRKHIYFKLPHKDGPQARCVSPLAKGYMQYFERGTLSSQYTLAKEALEMNASCSYWISARDRIMSQMVVYEDDVGKPQSSESESRVGYILPQIIPMGTITRRAVENTWLTASNAKENRVGSELKAMIKAPPGYVFVGADVDSQELWIASLIGDAQFQIHGGNAIGFMTLEGSKAAGTDMHSRTATILGISRNDAKVFNYGRIYGAGVKFAATLLRQFNPSMTEKQTQEVASSLYQATKGARTTRRILSDSPFWRGGTESFVFNKLEEFAEQERPRTPTLGAGITEALMRRFINRGSFMTSRINWAIQSSGVDYLHLLIVAMDYLIRRFNINARLAITVHDEIRYLVKDNDKYRAALALQIANVWTRAMFSQQVGINDLPQSCAYFSAVDIDHVLRKEVNMDCITPSHPHKIPHGESLDITQLLEKNQAAYLDPSIVPTSPPSPEIYPYTPRKSVMSSLQSTNDPAFIRAQITKDDKELREIIKEVTRAKSAAAPKDRAKPAGSAGPQKAILVDVGSGLYRDFRSPPPGSRHPQVNQAWKPRPTARA
ncbi:DNA polymerase family A-domain-containing protein [Aspergillus avenaceus]|uniref:DNA-directed DNA polymerase n=1 Tax=Aspergillus avenaceus TaxID=36643 RepID=A0A5N6TPA2_ASPAV|nr:DNA polymerase family A-domain-containing protein [Aspergillus avenaceus]